MLLNICKYIQANDKNSDIMDAYEDMLHEEIDLNTLVEICQNVLGDWKEDLQPLDSETKEYYDYLGI